MGLSDRESEGQLLVLTRKAGQSIMIGDDIEVHVTSVVGERARIDVAFRSARGEPVRVGMQVPRVLPMRASQSLTIGDDVEVSVLSVIGEKLRIGIQAPRSVPVYRSEVYVEIQREQAGVFAPPEVALAEPPPLL
jgi:carbon storage regulator